MKVDQKTLETIFETEGLDLNISEVHLQEEIPANVPQVYPQDVIDALRYISKNGLLVEGKSVFADCSQATHLIRYILPLDSKAEKQGITIPNLKLQLVKNDTSSVHGQLVYHWDNKDYYFAYFNLK